MKNKIIFILGFFLFNSASGQTSIAGVQLIGNIKGIGDSKLYIGKIGDYFMNAQIVDSFACKNDSFNYRTNIPVNNSLYCIKDINGQFIYFLPENDKIVIHGVSDNLIHSTIFGSENNMLLSDYWKSIFIISNKMMPLYSSLNKAQEEHDTIIFKQIKKQIDSLNLVMRIFPENFVAVNYEKTASAVVLYLYLGQYKSDKFKLIVLYKKLNKKVQESPMGKKISDFIASLEACEVGKPFIDFELKNRDNKSITISSLKGKCFLIEFWTTWCGPCRGELPTLSKAYEKYKPKGFEIISISLDNSKHNWINALDKQNSPWIQTIINNSESFNNYLAPFESDVAKAYSIQNVPANYLINPEGIIIAVDLRGKALLDKLIEIYKE